MISIQCADPKPTDADLRPWAYTESQREEAKQAIEDHREKEKEDSAMRAAVKLGGGGEWWKREG